MSDPSYENINSSFHPSDAVKFFHSHVSRFGHVDTLTAVNASDLDVASYKRGIAVNMGILVAFGIVLSLITLGLYIHSCLLRVHERTWGFAAVFSCGACFVSRVGRGSLLRRC